MHYSRITECLWQQQLHLWYTPVHNRYQAELLYSSLCYLQGRMPDRMISYATNQQRFERTEGQTLGRAGEDRAKLEFRRRNLQKQRKTRIKRTGTTRTHKKYHRYPKVPGTRMKYPYHRHLRCTRLHRCTL